MLQSIEQHIVGQRPMQQRVIGKNTDLQRRRANGEGQIGDCLPNWQYNLYTDARKFESPTASQGATAELAASSKYIDQIGIANIDARGVRLGLTLLEVARKLI